MYTIVDVETTGGKFNEEGITEIAIYKFDGHEIVDQFSSLVNPEKEIQPFVVKLTGINNKMLIKAPKFYQVAKRIIEITSDTILVAHNASFDYRMLRVEFERLGYEFEKQTLCTVQLAQRLMPDQPSHSLGKLTKALGIAIPNRHRASGDALATVKLFKMLLEKDLDKNILQQLLKTNQPKKVAPNFKRLLDEIPSTTGVYYLHDNDQNLVYVGKSKNIKKAATQHFLKDTRKARELQKLVTSISYEKTGSELIAILKEHQSLLTHQPKYNKRPRRTLFSHGIYLYSNKDGFHTISIKNIRSKGNYLTTFNSHLAAHSFLEKLANTHHLCSQLVGIKNVEDSSGCDDIDVVDHNHKLIQAIEPYNFNDRNCIVLDKGRTAAEHSVVLIENGTVKGYAYIDLQIQIKNAKMLQSILVSLETSSNHNHIVQNYLRHKKVIKIIELDKVETS